MKKSILFIAAIILFSNFAHSAPTPKLIAPTPCCDRLEHRMQLDQVAKRDDMKGIAYLYEKNLCAVVPSGTEYSVLQILNDYSKIRIYLNNKSFELWAATINVP